MALVKFHKYVAALPAELEPNAIYYVRAGAGFDVYVTNSSGAIVAYPANYLKIDGTAADSSKLGGTLAVEFYRRANILGTVSQLNGVPTGAIIERGSNANGEYVRYADGTQKCTRKAAPNGTTWTFPAPFISPPAVSLGTLSGNLARYSTLDAPTSTSTTVYGWTAAGSSSGTTTDLTADGRWY